MWIGKLVDDLRGEQPTEVMRGELQALEGRVGLGQLFAAAAEHVQHRCARDDARRGPEVSLHEERHRFRPRPFVRVVPGHQGTVLPFRV